jgi:hypothetical protein
VVIPPVCGCRTIVSVKADLTSNLDSRPSGFPLLAIGELAELAGKRPSSIRYYEQIGLLPGRCASLGGAGMTQAPRGLWRSGQENDAGLGLNLELGPGFTVGT